MNSVTRAKQGRRLGTNKKILGKKITRMSNRKLKVKIVSMNRELKNLEIGEENIRKRGRRGKRGRVTLALKSKSKHIDNSNFKTPLPLSKIFTYFRQKLKFTT
jgi:hypothetical protein